MFNFEKGFSTKDVVTTLGALTVVGMVAFFVLDWMSGSIDSAKESKYLSYASQMKKTVENANSLSAFRGVVTSDWVCLGAYSSTVGDYCWGQENSNIVNAQKVDNALVAVNPIPKGQLSPYVTFYNRGAAMRVNPRDIEIKFFVGHVSNTENFCRQLNMIVDPEDSLSCILSAPIKKN